MNTEKTMQQKRATSDELLTQVMGGNDEIRTREGKEVTFDADRAYRRFRDVTAGKGTHIDVDTNRRWLRYVAMIAVVVAVALFSRWNGQQSVTSQFADVTISAPLGSNTQLTLPDGTEVWLNAGSTITYSQGFGVENRRVSLNGEGYFEVTHDAERPFIVKSKTLEVKVLGTKFDFIDYQDDEVAIVSLLEGSVALKNQLRMQDAAILMKPNDRCMLNKRTGKISVETEPEVKNAKLWTEGQLFFDEAPLIEIAKILEHSYNVKVHIEADSLERISFYGQFARRENTISEVLDVLSATGKIKYRVENGEVYLYN